MRSSLWAKITGADKKLMVQDQQGVALGRVGDYTIIFPYGVSTDLPNNAMLRVIAPGIAMPWNIDRPSDGARGEPMFFHPSTNTRIIVRNNGDLDIIAEQVEGANGNINITCNEANITATDSVTFDAPEGTFTGNLSIDGDLQIDGDLNNDGAATLGGAGGAAIARTGDAVSGGVITGGSANHTAT